MAEEFDVIVVGARCAGSPLAALLARQGVRVAVVERATFPRDTLSSHIFQAPGINLLEQLGVLQRARATGAPCLRRLNFRQSQFSTRAAFPMRSGDTGGSMSVRRFVLDPLLAEAAADAGAEMMMASTVTSLVRPEGRVSGVRVATEGEERELSARLVVGADGRNSTVAKLTGARKYHVVPSERFAYWGFFEGADPGPDPELVFHHWEGRVVIGCPTDSGLYQVILVPDNRFLPAFREDLEGAFMEHARACAPVAEVIAGARRVGKLFGIVRFESFFRESAGPGWVLVGDAGQFKDPTPGQGMTDAFRQAAALAPAILGAITGSGADIDSATAAWAAWRDRDAFEHHWLACDLGAAGQMPAVLPEIMRRLDSRGQFDRFVDLLQHRTMPSKVITPPRLLSAAAGMLGRAGCDRRAVLREVGGLVVTDARRKRQRRYPVFVDPIAHADAGQTEVPHDVATRQEN
jgi:2-polyprenyl-6-methoxyphenol hydroxylase-like FAD-dependent oxidoreductase